MGPWAARPLDPPGENANKPMRERRIWQRLYDTLVEKNFTASILVKTAAHQDRAAVGVDPAASGRREVLPRKRSDQAMRASDRGAATPRGDRTRIHRRGLRASSGLLA